PIMFPTVTARPKVTPSTVRRRRAGRGTAEVYRRGQGTGDGGQVVAVARTPPVPCGPCVPCGYSDSLTDTGPFTVDSVTFRAPLPKESWRGESLSSSCHERLMSRHTSALHEIGPWPFTITSTPLP